MLDFDRWRAAAGDLLLGARCPGCDAPAWGVCAECRADVAARSPFRTQPDPFPEGFPPTVASSVYDPILRGAISAHKERQALGLDRWLGDRLALSAYVMLRSVQSSSPVWLVPVPSAAAAVRARGLDATWALASRAARRLSTMQPARPIRLLRQRRRVADQAGLSAADRARNLRGAFAVSARPPAGVVILIDDVVTTGSSLSEAARVLRAAGIEVGGAATVAATRLRRTAVTEVPDVSDPGVG